MYAFYIRGKRLTEYTPVSDYQLAKRRACSIGIVLGIWVDVKYIG